MAGTPADGSRDVGVQQHPGDSQRSEFVSLSGWLAAQLEQLIAERGLQPGERLPSERDLAHSFGVSRSVVRDAVDALERRGLVQSRAGSGTYLSGGNQDLAIDSLTQLFWKENISLPELVETRLLIELRNVAVAAARAEQTSIEELTRALDRHRRCTAPRELVRCDLDFHEILSQAAGNHVLAMIFSGLRPLLEEGMLLHTLSDGSHVASIEQHACIIEAIKAGNTAAATAAMHGHIQNSYRALDESGFLQSVPEKTNES